MRYSTHLRMGSREQHPSIRLQEKSVTLQANRVKKSLEYNKVENPLYVGQRHEHAVHLQPVMNFKEPVKDVGPVKHMRNLPGYLQRVEKGYNIQGKALNFGVLDWSRLENWKSNEKRVPPRFNMKTSSLSTNNPTFVESRSVRVQRNKKKYQQTPNGSPGVRWPRGKPVKPQISQHSPCSVDLPHGSSKGKSEKETSSSGDDTDINHVDVHCFDPPNPFSDVPHSCPFPLPLSADVESPTLPPVTPSHHADLDVDVQHAMRGKQPSSPNKRFSFSLGKMARSFSFKESSNTVPSVPQPSPTYISVRSGPVSSQASSPDSVNHNRMKSTASPLRRLLDPLRKLKGTHLDEKIHKPKPDIIPNSVTPVNEKRSFSNVQALLQLTLKDGIPFFKLVVESSSDILAAAVKKLPTGKDDTSLIYSFYSVHETTKKKSGGWIHQSSKEKPYGFGYNIVGQMKISSSYHAEFSGSEKDLYVVRESVLYSSDDGELAAVIVKNPSDVTCGDIGSCKSMIVVLPDGVHSWPNRGSPSPLINRWKSGGACDCGGWDVGCQFRILSHQNEILMTTNCLDLSYQVGKKNKCSFRLVYVEDGLYSLEYDPSMSMIQAFSICVAVVSSQKLTHIFQVNYVPEPRGFTSGKKVKSLISKPPVSPVGRV